MLDHYLQRCPNIETICAHTGKYDILYGIIIM